MATEVKYTMTIDSAFSLSISKDNVAQVSFEGDEPVTVQLADDAEAQKMIAEFEDRNGDLMWEEGAIFGKYEELHQFRP